MSHDRVEIVKAAIEACNRKDWDALLQTAAHGFELDMSRSMGPGRGVYGLIGYDGSSKNSPRAGSRFGLNPTSSSRPVISSSCRRRPT
jgi:hypothetical protein